MEIILIISAGIVFFYGFTSGNSFFSEFTIMDQASSNASALSSTKWMLHIVYINL